jgi:hypothetical protein
MTDESLHIEVEDHPILRPAAFTTGFPKPLGEMVVHSWLRDLLAGHATALGT